MVINLANYRSFILEYFKCTIDTDVPDFLNSQGITSAKFVGESLFKYDLSDQDIVLFLLKYSE